MAKIKPEVGLRTDFKYLQTKRRIVSTPVREDDIENAAARGELSPDEIEQALDQVQEAAEDDVGDLFESAFHTNDKITTPAVVICHHPAEHLIFGANTEYLDHVSDEADLTDVEAQAVQDAFYSYAEYRSESGFGVNRETVAKNRNNLLVIEKPDGWGTAQLVAIWEFGSLCSVGLTPAEALDYWVIEQQDWTPNTWSESRRVGPEAIRKNCRQAREKLND